MIALISPDSGSLSNERMFLTASLSGEILFKIFLLANSRYVISVRKDWKCNKTYS